MNVFNLFTPTASSEPRKSPDLVKSSYFSFVCGAMWPGDGRSAAKGKTKYSGRISSTSSLLSCLLPTSLHHTPLLALSLFCLYLPLYLHGHLSVTQTLHCTSSNFPMQHSPFVLSPYAYLRSPPPMSLFSCLQVLVQVRHR